MYRAAEPQVNQSLRTRVDYDAEPDIDRGSVGIAQRNTGAAMQWIVAGSRRDPGVAPELITE
jgi:hypothetical protein